MHRPTIGIIALVLLASAVLLWLRPLDWGGQQALLAACVRLGAVMSALWLAHPQVSRLPGWIVPTVLVAAIVVAIRPKLIVIAVPLIIALCVLRPR